MTESDVSIRKLVKRFGTMTADGIDSRCRAVVTFLGPSGCGKTTTLRMIGGFEHPDSGQIPIQGQNIATARPQTRHSMVFRTTPFPT